ncbi:MAG: quinol dehydrogenase ferredoxin subunit NapH [Bacteroidetes bacterium 4484_276]|nr:MAG: quinol dehydrogenase ferredoxin subunit NapH [Bacteroidetes bacterium 4484_276]
MSKLYSNYRFLILRRIVQISFLVLFAGANYWGWNVLMGNYSSALVLGQFYLTDPHAVLQTLAAGFLVATDALIGAAIIFLFYALVGGRGFCSWVCPMNMVTDLALWTRKKFFKKQKAVLQNVGRNTRYWILGLGLVLSFITGAAAFEAVSPIGMLHRGIIFGFGMGWAIVSIVFLFDLFVLKNGWCGHICPLGAFYSASCRYSLIKVKHDAEKCNHGMKCKTVCPEKQVLHNIGKKSGFILSGECTNCGRCIEVCEEDALKFSLNNYKK